MADILVIDDDPTVREVIRKMVETAGHSVREAEDGLQGLQQYRQNPADVVIADILMPVMGGLEAIKEIRSGDPQAKIIAVTGYDPNEEIGYLCLAEECGAARTFRKPVMMPDLLQAISELTA